MVGIDADTCKCLLVIDPRHFGGIGHDILVVKVQGYDVIFLCEFPGLHRPNKMSLRKDKETLNLWNFQKKIALDVEVGGVGGWNRTP